MHKGIPILILALIISSCSSKHTVSSNGYDAVIDSAQDAGADNDATKHDATKHDATKHDSTKHDAKTDVQTDLQIDPCGKAPPRFSGSLCGTAANPCTVLRDEILIVDGATGYTGPSLDLLLDDQGEPSMLARNDGGTYLVRTGPDQWAKEKLPISIYGGYLVRESPGSVLALLNPDSGGAASLWKRDGSGWHKLDDLSGWAAGFARDEGGCLHAALKASDRVAYARRQQDWITFAQTSVWSEAPVLTLASDGRAQLAYFEASTATSKGWRVQWAEPTSAPQTALDLGTSALSEFFIGLATSQPAGAERQMHVLAWRRKSTGTGFELVQSTRKASSSTWQVTTVLPHLTAGTLCSHDPAYTGEQCSFDNEQLIAHGLIMSGNGEARVLYTKIRRWGSRVGTCTEGGWGGGGGGAGGGADAAPLPPIPCTWEAEEEQVDSWLMLASLSGTVVEQTVVLQGGLHEVAGFRAKLDSKGRIHLATYDHLDKAPNLTDLRYLLVGPTP